MTRRAFACLVALMLIALPALAHADATVTAAALGTSIDKDYHIANPSTEFAQDAPAIHCAWSIDGVGGEVTVRSVWIAEDVGKVAPPNYRIDEASIKMGGDGSGQFQLSKPNNGFPTGKYRVEIYIDNKLAKTVPFTVK
jgi:hypothetical protein